MESRANQYRPQPDQKQPSRQAGEGTPSHDWEHFREIAEVLVRRHYLWLHRPKNQKEIDEAERWFQHQDKMTEKWHITPLSPKEREVFYIKETIDVLGGFYFGSDIMDAASIFTDEDLETMRPFDPEFIDEILSARPNHPTARAKSERIMQRLNQELNGGKPPWKR